MAQVQRNVAAPVAAPAAPVVVAAPAPVQSPQQAALARLQAALQVQGSSSGPSVQAVLAALTPGKAYTLRQIATACNYTPRKRPNGKTTHAPLRATMRQAVNAGKVVTMVTGGYPNQATGNMVGGKAFYMVV